MVERPQEPQLGSGQALTDIPALLSQLGTVSSFAKWLNPLRMVGMAFLFTSITLALMVIIGTLRLQAGLLVDFYQKASGE